MQENYFTGDIKKHHQQVSQTANATQNSVQQKNQPIQNSFKKMNVTEQTQIQPNEQQKKQCVDVKQVIVQKQQIQEEKFIQSNPTIAADQKQIGNNKYVSGQYSEALQFYRKSLQYTNNQFEEDIKFRSIIYSNIGLTYMKMRQDQTAIEYFKNSLKLNDKYTKARTNLAQCYQNIQKIQEALDQYKKVLEICPNDKYVKPKIVPLQFKVKQLQQKRKQQVLGGLKNIGNSILGYFGMSLDNFKLQQGQGGGYNISFKQ